MTLTSIPLTSLETGGTEQQTQAVIDALQAKGWRVFWGIGTKTYRSESERLAFEADLRQEIARIRERDKASGTNPGGHSLPPLRDGGTAGEPVAAKFRI